MRPFPYPCNLLYHQYLKGDTQWFEDDDSVRSAGSTCQATEPFPQRPYFNWDLRSNCKPMDPAFQYISRKLAGRGLQIALIVSEREPCVIPIWHLPERSQILLTRIVRSACARYKIQRGWLMDLASICSKKDLPKVFEAYKSNSYIIRRSILQHEIIFSGEGLTLLSIDHIYTLKQLLCTLAKKEWVSYSRQVCLFSCVHLFHRINTIYNGINVTKGYIARVYPETALQEAALDEVLAEYGANSCEASIRDVTSDLDFSTLYDGKPQVENSAAFIAELQDTSPYGRETSDNELINPLMDIDLSTLYSWEPAEPAGIELVSPVTVTYPPVRPLSRPPPARCEQEAETWYRSVPSSPVNISESGSFDTAPPPPLRIVKRASTQPSAEQRSVEGWHFFPPAVQEEEARNDEDEEEEEEEKEDVWRRDSLDARSREIVDAWFQAVPVCSNCHEVMEVPRRHTLCC